MHVLMQYIRQAIVEVALREKIARRFRLLNRERERSTFVLRRYILGCYPLILLARVRRQSEQ